MRSRRVQTGARDFQKAVEQLDVPLRTILHVGDSLEMDEEGARRLCGMQTIERKNKPLPAKPKEKLNCCLWFDLLPAISSPR